MSGANPEGLFMLQCAYPPLGSRLRSRPAEVMQVQAIMSGDNPEGLFHPSPEKQMPKAAILIDGGYLLKRLPHVRPDIDSHDSYAVVGAIDQLVASHLNKLNRVHCVADHFQLLYRIFTTMPGPTPSRNAGR